MPWCTELVNFIIYINFVVIGINRDAFSSILEVSVLSIFLLDPCPGVEPYLWFCPISPSIISCTFLSLWQSLCLIRFNFYYVILVLWWVPEAGCKLQWLKHNTLSSMIIVHWKIVHPALTWDKYNSVNFKCLIVKGELVGHKNYLLMVRTIRNGKKRKGLLTMCNRQQWVYVTSMLSDIKSSVFDNQWSTKENWTFFVFGMGWNFWELVRLKRSSKLKIIMTL